MQIVISGLAVGCVYGLIALGFVLIYKATETVNFAQGELMMIGAYFAYTMAELWHWPFLPSVLFAILATALVGAAIERVLLRPIEGEPTIAVIMVTLAIGMIARGVASAMPGWGTDTHHLRVPYQGGLVDLFQARLSMEHIVIVCSTAGLCLALFYFFRAAKLGLAMRAVSQNQLAAYYIGIPVSGTNARVWALSGGIAAVAGILMAPITFVHINMGSVGVMAIPAAVIGGFGSIPGAVAGGLILGLCESLAGLYLPEGFKDAAPHVLVLLVLMIKPSGLFADQIRKKV